MFNQYLFSISQFFFCVLCNSLFAKDLCENEIAQFVVCVIIFFFLFFEFFFPSFSSDQAKLYTFNKIKMFACKLLIYMETSSRSINSTSLVRNKVKTSFDDIFFGILGFLASSYQRTRERLLTGINHFNCNRISAEFKAQQKYPTVRAVSLFWMKNCHNGKLFQNAPIQDILH